jgi:hypothetical protein
VRWLWPGRIPLGELTILAGDPGLGKSLLSVYLVALTTSGRLGEPRNALMLTAEDSPEHTVAPRLRAAGADPSRVGFGVVEKGGFESPFVLPNDVPLLRELVEAQQPRLLVIDPLAAHLSAGIDSWKDPEVRRALEPLHGLASESGAAVLIVAHLNKRQSDDPLQRLGGSVGIPAAARSVLLLGRDPADAEGEHGSQRVLAHVKSNLSRPAPSLSFAVENMTLESSATEELETARIVERGESHFVGRDLLAPATGAGRSSKLGLGVDLLKNQLAGGPQPVKRLEEAAKAAGISVSTLNRAKSTLGLKPEKVGRGWVLRLTAEESDGNETDNR